MADNYTKLWLQKTSNKLAISRAKQAIENLGRALPCSVVAVNGSIVTVKFEMNAAPLTLPNITIPKAEGPWIRSPTQVGDKGMTVPADVYLGGISGLGGGVATFAPQGGLTALVFMPVASSHFTGVNTNSAYVSGPEGAVIQDEAGTCIVNVSPGSLDVTAPISTYNGNVYVNGNLGASSGATGSFTTVTGQTVTVTNGLITNIF